jgi:hypothetical protein
VTTGRLEREGVAFADAIDLALDAELQGTGEDEPEFFPRVVVLTFRSLSRGNDDVEGLEQLPALAVYEQFLDDAPPAGHQYPPLLPAQDDAVPAVIVLASSSTSDSPYAAAVLPSPQVDR